MGYKAVAVAVNRSDDTDARVQVGDSAVVSLQSKV
jgi:hypothetical protein